jgi:hypothetical protein
LCRLWSRPYQSGQLFSTGGKSGLALADYLSQIAFTDKDIRAYPPVFATPFVGTHVVAFTIHPPVRTAPTALATWQVQCSYHFTVNGSCAVQVIPSPAAPNSVLVIVKLDSAGFPSLPEPPSQMDTYSIDSLLKQAPSGVDVSLLQKIFLKAKGDVYVRRYAASQTSKTRDSVNVVPFTSINAIANTTGWATDNSQPFPIYGWVRLRWVDVQPSAHQ